MTDHPEGTLVLPLLEEDCPDCAGPEAVAARAALAREWNLWHEEEDAGYTEFAAKFDRANSYGTAYEAWTGSDAYRALVARQPEDMGPEKGCVECDYTSLVPTAAGRQVLDFLARHTSR